MVLFQSIFQVMRWYRLSTNRHCCSGLTGLCKNIFSDLVSTRAEEQLHTLIFPRNSCHLHPVLKFRMPDSLSMRVHPPPCHPAGARSVGSALRQRAASWRASPLETPEVGRGLGLCPAAEPERENLVLEGSSRVRLSVSDPGQSPGQGSRMLNVPSQSFPAPSSQQRVASGGRSKVSW